ncbi:MAG TPA: RteC domain-containing protein [Puia sp.]|nr:RteC domain-containing protein [Puia sp.]
MDTKQQPMIDQWQELYREMRRETMLIQRTEPRGLERTEHCFKSCLRHWEGLRRWVKEHGLGDDRNEIRFFKYIKPQFTGRLEFHILAYQYQTFHPMDDPFRNVTFLHREKQKIAAYRDKHQDFLNYYAGGKTDQDELLFLRRTYLTSASQQLHAHVRVYDQDPDLSTTGDWLVTLHVGFKLYEQFLDNEARLLTTGRTSGEDVI